MITVPRCKSWTSSHWQLLIYFYWNVDGFSLQINQLPKVASASSPYLLPLPPLPFLISTIHCCQAEPRSSSLPFLHPLSSHFNTSTSQGPCSSIHASVPSHSPAHPALIYCPCFLWAPSFSPSLQPRLALLPTTPSTTPPSIILSNGHQGRESPCSSLGQTPITYTVTLGWGHSHPFCTRSHPPHSPLQSGRGIYRSPNSTNKAYHTHWGKRLNIWCF